MSKRPHFTYTTHVYLGCWAWIKGRCIKEGTIMDGRNYDRTCSQKLKLATGIMPQWQP